MRSLSTKLSANRAEDAATLTTSVPQPAEARPEICDPLTTPTQSSPPLGGILADEFIAVLITTIAMRLSRGSTNFYRARWDIGMLDWRVLLALDRTQALNVGALADAAGLDKAAVSRSLGALGERGIVTVEQTRSRGRAAIAALTPAGRALCGEILAASRKRQNRLFKAFPKNDTDALAATLRRFAQALDEVGWDESP